MYNSSESSFEKNRSLRDLYPWPYSIDSSGTVYNNKTGNPLQPAQSTRGFLQVTLRCGLERHTFDVHRLVMYTFGDRKNLRIRHLDGNKHNNNFENLVYEKKKRKVKPKNIRISLKKVVYQKELFYLTYLPGIFISESARVLSYRTATKKILTQSKNKAGYLRVCVYPGKTYYVHHLFASAFMPNRPPQTRIGFIDNNRENISLENLFSELCT